MNAINIAYWVTGTTKGAGLSFTVTERIIAYGHTSNLSSKSFPAIIWNAFLNNNLASNKHREREREKFFLEGGLVCVFLKRGERVE